MLISRRSPLTGVITTRNLPITEAQVEAYNSGEGYIQDIFPNLSSSEREFIKTGYTSEDWEYLTGSYRGFDDE